MKSKIKNLLLKKKLNYKKVYFSIFIFMISISILFGIGIQLVEDIGSGSFLEDYIFDGNITFNGVANFSQANIDYSTSVSVGLYKKERVRQIFQNPNAYQVCATFEDDSFRCWASNSGSRLGLGAETTDKYYPTKTILNNITQYVAGHYNACALENNGKIWCWGYNGYGTCGDGTTTQKFFPVNIMNNTRKIIRSGNLDSATYCAIKTDDTLWCWGRNSQGQVGDGTTTQRNSPVQVLTNVKDIASNNMNRYYQPNTWTLSYSRILALKNDGTVWAWGYNGQGQIGDGTTTQRNSPVRIGSFNNIEKIYSGSGYAASSYAIDSNGILYVWGYNGLGQLGLGDTTQRNSPQVLNSLSNVKEVFPERGYHYNVVCATLLNNSFYCWGYNNNGKIGDGTTTQRNSPVHIMDNVVKKSLTSIDYVDYTDGTTDKAHYATTSCVIKTDGSVWCWGYNGYGAVGDGTSSDSYVPKKVIGLEGRNIIDISSRDWYNQQTNFALDDEGILWSWGSGEVGFLANGQVISYQAIPQPIKQK